MNAGYSLEDFEVMLDDSWLRFRRGDPDDIVLEVVGLGQKPAYSMQHMVDKLMDVEDEEGIEDMLDLARMFERLAKELRRTAKDLAA